MQDRIDKLDAGYVKLIHVDQHAIKHNRQMGVAQRPPITVQTSAGSLKMMGCRIMGESELVYSYDKPLPCGAHLWVETAAEVEELY